MKKKIVCFHLLNDCSGSPKVLQSVLDSLCKRGREVELVTSNTHGVLDSLQSHPNFCMHTYSYKFSDNPVVTMLCYTWVQMLTFFMAWKYLFQKNVVFYINTILPVGPAIAGRMMGKRVVYHYHENAFVKGNFYKILAWIMSSLAHEIICVSAYQASFLKRKDGVTVIPNALTREFVAKLKPNPVEAFERKNVLMLSSLKEYKGTKEFIQLAAKMPQYKFTIVINDTQGNIDKYLNDNQLIPPPNLLIYSRQTDVTKFYNIASVLLNLTDKTQAIETFGMTPLEAMSCGLPVIVPTVGGIAELVITR